MALSVPKIKAAADIIAARYGITAADAARVFEYYNGRKMWDASECVQDTQNCGLICAALKALKIPFTEPQTSAETITAERMNKGTEQKEKKRTKTEKTAPRAEAMPRPFDGVEPSTVADVIPADFPAGALPADFQNRIRMRLDDFKTLNGFDDLSKIAGVQWRAACLFVGQYIKASGILHDRERERTHGGTVYDTARIMALIDLWEYFTMTTKHIPLIGDGAAFCGISRDWLYDTKSDALTSRRVSITKKLERIEREALSAGVVDARENPTGRIWFEKSRYGMTEAPQVTVNVTADLGKVSALPKFDD